MRQTHVKTLVSAMKPLMKTNIHVNAVMVTGAKTVMVSQGFLIRYLVAVRDKR